MASFVLDTNIYVSASRDPHWAAELSRFSRVALPRTYLHAVVAQELLSGGIGDELRRDIHEAVVAPFERRRRLVTPSFRAWVRSGEAVAQLASQRIISPGGFAKSFLNDVLLAASCREHGLTLVTRNLADFERIRRVLEFDFSPPWPE